MAGFSTIDFLPQNCLFGRYSKAPPLSHITYKVIDDVDASVNGLLEKQREDVQKESIRWHGVLNRRQSDIKEYAAAVATKKKSRPVSALASGCGTLDISRDRRSSVTRAVKPRLLRPGVGLKAGARRAAGTRHDFLAKVASSSLRSSDRLALLAKRLKHNRRKGQPFSPQDLLAATRAACKIHHGMSHSAMGARKRPGLGQRSTYDEIDSRAQNYCRDKSRSRSQAIREERRSSRQLTSGSRMDGIDDSCDRAELSHSDSKACQSRSRNLCHTRNHDGRERHQSCESRASDDENGGYAQGEVEMCISDVGKHDCFQRYYDSDRSNFRDEHDCHSSGDKRSYRSSGGNIGRQHASHNSDRYFCGSEDGGHSWGDEECCRSDSSECHSMHHELDDCRNFPDGEERNKIDCSNRGCPRNRKVFTNAENHEVDEICSIEGATLLPDCVRSSNELPCGDRATAERRNLKRRLRRRRRLNASRSNDVHVKAALVSREKAQTRMTGTLSEEINTSQIASDASCLIERRQSLPSPSPAMTSVVVLDEESDLESSDVEIQEHKPPPDYALQINNLAAPKNLAVSLPPPTIHAGPSCRVPAPDYAPWV